MKSRPSNPPIEVNEVNIDVVEMTDNKRPTDLREEFDRAEYLMERYIALHDLRFRAGDIEFLSEPEDKIQRERVAARTEEVIRNADSILKGTTNTGWPRPAGR